MPNYHVIKPKNSQDWKVKKAGADRASAIAPTQKLAEQLAKRFAAHAGGGEVRIHKTNGKIRDSDTVAPGNDPNPPKDKKH